MAAPGYFVIVGKGDTPLYELDVNTGKKGDQSQLKQFIVHAALDAVDEMQWTTNNLYLKVVDRFNESSISAFITAGYVKFLLLHDMTDRKFEDNVRQFFNEVYELLIKVQLNPFYTLNTPIKSKVFDAKVKKLYSTLVRS